VLIPLGTKEGRHTLIPGATGSGKSVTAAWVTGRMVEVGHGAVVIDPKGDELLCKELQRVAAACGARFLEWSFDGPCVYNPYAHGKLQRDRR
jgi:type IV secretory pathway VirB4 component